MVDMNFLWTEAFSKNRCKYMFVIEKKFVCEQLERISQMVNRLLNIRVVKNQVDQFNH